MEEADTAGARRLLLAAEAQGLAASVRELAVGWPPDVEARYVLGVFHLGRQLALTDGEDGDLSAAITLLGPIHGARPDVIPLRIREVLDQISEWRDRAEQLAEAAEESGDLEAVLEAEDLVRRVVSVTAPDDLLRPERLAALGNVLLLRHELTGDVPALEEAGELGREAVARTPAGHPDLTLHLSSLGNFLE